MDVTVVEQVDVKCVACGHEQPWLRWFLVDLVARPELRAVLEDPGSYVSACQVCSATAPRDTALLVVGLAEEAPVVLACPDSALGPGDFTVGSEEILDHAREALRRDRRTQKGPLLPVPFDVLAAAAARDVDADCQQSEAAARQVERQFGPKTRERYEKFLGYLAASRAQRRFDLAYADLFLSRDGEQLANVIRDGGPSFIADARKRCAARREDARSVGDEFGIGILTAEIALLESCAVGEFANGLARFVESMSTLHDRFDAETFQPLRAAVDQAPSFADAVEACERLIAHARDYANDPEEAAASVHLASLFWERRDGDETENFERARELLERALEIMGRDPDARGSDLHLSALVSLGAVLGSRVMGDPAGNQARAVQCQRDVVRLTSKRRNGRVWAMAQTNLGLALLEHAAVAGDGDAADEIDEAVQHFKQALKWRSFDRDPNDWAYTQINLALAYVRGERPRPRQDLKRSLRHVAEAIRGFTAAGNTLGLSTALGNSASARLDLAQLPDTPPAARRQLLEAAEADARAAIATIGHAVHGVDAGRRWWQLGRVLMAERQYTTDLVATASRALEDLTPESAPYECRDVASSLGAMAANANDWQVAAEAWERAVLAGVNAVDARAMPEGRFSETAKNLNMCRWAAYALTRAGDPRRAIELLELGRAYELATWLGRDVVDLKPVREADPQLCGLFLDLERQVAESERAGLRADDVSAAAIAERFKGAIGQIRLLPGLDGFLKRRTLTELVDAMTVDDSIAYPLTAQGAAWLILRKGSDSTPDVEVVDVPNLTSTTAFEALSQIDRAANTVDGFLTAVGSDDDTLDLAIAQVASCLGPVLVRPLARALAARGAQSVCIVPIGLLALVPLHALSWDDGTRERCLLDEVDVTYAPSALVRVVCQARATREPAFERLLAVGNPMPQTNPLPGAELEASLVHAIVPAHEKVLLLNAAATKDAVLAELPNASHVHLACHGRAAVTDPRGFDAALSFAKDTPASAADILDLDLSRLRLVAASACQTAVVPSYEGADEALSLSSIFLAAGVAGVVASLWSVDDYATRFLMGRFYEELVATPENPARALRYAQIWLRDLTEDEEAHYAMRHAELRIEHARRHPERAVRTHSEQRPVAVVRPSGLGRASVWAAFALSGA